MKKLIKKLLREGLLNTQKIKEHLYNHFNLNGVIEPASKPTKDGYLRLYHQTDLTNFEAIKKTGKISISQSTGKQNMEPTVVWGKVVKNKNDRGFYGEPKERFTIEYQIPKNEVDPGTGGVDRDVASSEIIAYHDPRLFNIKEIVDNDDYLNEIIRGLDYWVSYKDSDTSSPEYAYTLIANEIKKYNDGGDKSTTKIKMPNKKIPSKDAWTVSSAEYVGVDVDKVVADHKSGKISKEDMEEILHGDNYKNVNKYREWLNSHIEPYSAGLISKDELPERVIYKVKEYIDAPKEIMYHVTIATDSVKEKGLKTKDEVLAMGGSEGIGGGEGISLTTSNKYANRLFNSMTELQDMLNGKVNLFNLFKEVDERTGKGKDILQTVKSMYGLKEEKTIDFLKNPRDITIESPFYGPKTYKKDDIIRTFYNGLSFNDDEREWMATMGGIDEKFKDAKIGMFEVTVSDKAKGTWHPAEFEFRVYSSGAIKNIKHIR